MDDRGRPSVETPLHLALYRQFPGAGAILHVHAPNATLISLRAGAQLTLSGYELLKGLAGIETHEAVVTIPVLDNDQQVSRLARAAEAALVELDRPVAYLIRGHGIYTWGATPLRRRAASRSARDGLRLPTAARANGMTGEQITIEAILTDLEGTTTSISFVKDVLFPYARQHLPAFVGPG